MRYAFRYCFALVRFVFSVLFNGRVFCLVIATRANFFSRLSRLRARLAAFAVATGGVLAVEFALLAGPLILLLICMFELGSNQLHLQQVERIAQRATLLLRTGEIRAADYTAQSFRSDVLCKNLVLLTCGNIVVNLSSPQSSERITGANVSGAKWCPGAAHEVRLLQIAYPVPLLSRIWAGTPLSTPYFIASNGLRNAPDAQTGACA